ncbi:hypothetical protein J437_LFUL005985 [Ladona fulva]|uniref:Uncharacterized protein n=1 Tax=Ladona fulva TaxID=123851 RepID=A0A8K0K0B9_LADFU|nr:hypothetical protein J437_LFUL005985 [Ladona fulva]
MARSNPSYKQLVERDFSLVHRNAAVRGTFRQEGECGRTTKRQDSANSAEQFTTKWQKERENVQKQRTHEFKEVDKVLLKTPKVSNTRLILFQKFFPIFSGPYFARKVVGKNACELEE